MSLIKWEPFSDMDHFFEDFNGGLSAPKMGFDLAVDVYEDGDTIIAEMNLPGIDPEKVDVSVEDGFLRIAGSRSDEKEEKKKNYYSKEIRRGSFERVVRLPHAVEQEGVNAEYENGVLKVLLPKKLETKGSKVKVVKK